MTNHMQANQWAIKQKNIISKLNITALYWESLHRNNSCTAYVLKFFSSRRNWDSPNPSPAGECAQPPLVLGGGAHSRRERGWESPNSDEGTYTVVLFIYMYFVVQHLCLCTDRKEIGVQIHPLDT
jgi:hypothetical protein